MCLDAKLVLIAGKPLSEILLLEVFFVLLPLWLRCHDVDFIQEYLDLPLILKGFVHWATPWPPSASSNCTVQQLFVFFSISLWIHEQQSDKFDDIMNDYFWVVIRFSKFQSFIHKIYLLIFQFFPLLFLTFFFHVQRILKRTALSSCVSILQMKLCSFSSTSLSSGWNKWVRHLNKQYTCI